MKKLVVLVVSLVIASGVMGGLAGASDRDLVEDIMEARSAVKKYANPTAQQPDLTLAKAYDVQIELAKRTAERGNAIAGFKAGLTSQGAQKKFGVEHALLGPLFEDGKLAPGTEVKRSAFVLPFVEAEIGYVVGTRITEPIENVESLKSHIVSVFPAFELPDLRYSELKKLTAADIAADGVASAKYVVGPAVKADSVDVSQVHVTVSLDGSTVIEGKASDALGDQWKALLWLVNGIIDKGWTIEPGQILITGALGKMIPAKPGTYEADFGELGKLSFTMK